MVAIIVFLERVFRNNKYKFKGKCLKLYLLLHGCKVGKKLRCHRFPNFRSVPFKNLQIGNHVTIGYAITFEMGSSGEIIIGNKVNLTQNIIISTNKKVSIGDNVLVAENVSIRDSNHQIEIDTPIIFQPHTSKAVVIRNDVWIGAGVVILSGSQVPDGVVLGANSLVNEKSKLKANSVYAGSPVRFIKNRV